MAFQIGSYSLPDSWLASPEIVPSKKTRHQLARCMGAFLILYKTGYSTSLLRMVIGFGNRRDRKLSLLDVKFYGCADLLLYFYIHKLGDEDDVNAILDQVTFGKCQSFNRLVDGTGSNGLDFRAMVFPEDASDCARYGRGTGGALNFDNVH
jgi:hypothetical protein